MYNIKILFEKYDLFMNEFKDKLEYDTLFENKDKLGIKLKEITEQDTKNFLTNYKCFSFNITEHFDSGPLTADTKFSDIKSLEMQIEKNKFVDCLNNIVFLESKKILDFITNTLECDSINEKLKIYSHLDNEFQVGKLHFLNYKTKNQPVECLPVNDSEELNKYKIIKYNKIDKNCFIQRYFINEHTKAILKYLTQSKIDDYFEINGSKIIKISSTKEIIDDFDNNSYSELCRLTEFLISDGSKLEKVIIVKNVISLYLNEDTSILEFYKKIGKINETNEHYLENYLRNDLDNFFELRSTVYKESMEIANSISSKSQQIINFIFGTLLSFIFLAITTFLEFDKQSGSFKILTSIFFSLMFLLAIKYIVSLYIQKSLETFESQFDFVLENFVILTPSEVTKIKNNFFELPKQNINKLLNIFKGLLTVLFLIMVFSFIYFYFSTFIFILTIKGILVAVAFFIFILIILFYMLK